MIAKYFFSLIVLQAACLGQQAEIPVYSSSIVGSVTSADGAPLMSKVFVYQIITKDGRGHPVVACSSETSDDGKYTCALPPGRYILVAQPHLSSSKPLQDTSGQPTIAIQHAVTSAYRTGFYPNASTLSDAQSITLKHGEYRVANIAINKTPVEDIKGSIPGKPTIARIHLSLHGDSYDLPTNFMVAYDPENGRFVAHDVPQGEYLLEAFWFDAGATRHSSRIVTGGRNPNEIVLREDALVDVRGTVTHSGEVAKQHSTVSLECGSWGARHRYSAPVSDDGSFEIPSIPVSQCSIMLASAGSLYIRSAEANNKAIDLSNFSLMPPVMKLKIEMSDKTGVLHGTITDIPSGTADAGVVAESVDSGEITAVRVDSQATFSISELPVGEYRLYAVPDLANFEYRNPKYLHLMENDGVNLDIKADQSESIALQISPGALRASFQAAN